MRVGEVCDHLGMCQSILFRFKLMIKNLYNVAFKIYVLHTTKIDIIL